MVISSLVGSRAAGVDRKDRGTGIEGAGRG